MVPVPVLRWRFQEQFIREGEMAFVVALLKMLVI